MVHIRRTAASLFDINSQNILHTYISLPGGTGPAGHHLSMTMRKSPLVARWRSPLVGK